MIFDFFFFLSLLYITDSRLIIFTTTDKFIVYAKYYSIIYMYPSFFIHSSVAGHAFCFHVLGIINKAGVNNGVRVF